MAFRTVLELDGLMEIFHVPLIASQDNTRQSRDIQIIIAECIRDVLVALKADKEFNKSLIGERTSPWDGSSDRFSQIKGRLLDVTTAERLDGGSLLLASVEECFALWLIFVRTATQVDPSRVQFSLHGVVNALLDPVSFVGAAYRCILNRAVDESGKDYYSDLLLSGRMTHYEFLRRLASSPEAQDRRERLLIVPGRTGLGADIDNFVFIPSEP